MSAESPTYIYSTPPEQASSAEQLEWLLLTTPTIKVEVNLCRYERARWLHPEEAWMADESGPGREVALAEADAHAALCRRNGVQP